MDKGLLQIAFNNELTRSFPFIDIFDKEPFRGYLLKEFVAVENEKPCFSLYVRQFFKDEQLKNGFKEADKNVPVAHTGLAIAHFVQPTKFEIRFRKANELFYQRQAKDSLVKKFYCPDITETSIFKSLKRIEQAQARLWRTFKKEGELEFCFDVIRKSLDDVEYKDLKIEVVKALIDEDFNVYLIDCESDFREWNDVKFKLNCLLNSVIPPSKSKNLSQYFDAKVSDHFVEYVTSEIRHKKPKEIAFMIIALKELEIFSYSSLNALAKSITAEIGVKVNRQALGPHFEMSYKDLQKHDPAKKEYIDKWISKFEKEMH